MEKDPPPESHEPSSIKRFFHYLKNIGSPDTPEELEHEIQELIEEGQEQGLISSKEGLMINSILELKDTLAREVMTPRNEMVFAPDTATTGELTALIVREGFTRIPIYSENPDHIVGIIHAKDLLNFAGTDVTLGETNLVKLAHFVQETENIVRLLHEFQAGKIHLAIVTDEFGITRGLVTMEDILEEIVGEISDEHDESNPPWKVLDEQNVIIDAKINLEEVAEFFGVTFPEGSYESVGGLIIHELGRVPKTGMTIEIPPLTFTVILATKRRILKLQITRSV